MANNERFGLNEEEKQAALSAIDQRLDEIPDTKALHLSEEEIAKLRTDFLQHNHYGKYEDMLNREILEGKGELGRLNVRLNDYAKAQPAFNQLMRNHHDYAPAYLDQRISIGLFVIGLILVIAGAFTSVILIQLGLLFALAGLVLVFLRLRFNNQQQKYPKQVAEIEKATAQAKKDQDEFNRLGQAFVTEQMQADYRRFLANKLGVKNNVIEQLTPKKTVDTKPQTDQNSNQ
jgi:tetratricopeptide (TPR) repeat protein